ncbi:STN domain-containing protein [Xanthomonas sp. NCPPB 1325]|uniref:STN domain-containing protein n=1 Tax=Xanthomonas sp. NCPPB 1325 TaxID=487529 RepID=UPI003555D505
MASHGCPCVSGAVMSAVRRRLSSIVIAVGAVMCAGPVMAACQPGPFTLALSAQRLDERLQDLAHQAGCAVEVDPSLLQDKRVQALSGTFTADQAFIQSVRGSGLEADYASDHWRVNRAQQLYFAERVETLQSAITDARKSNAITGRQAKTMNAQLSKMAVEVPKLVRQQGFLSAAERASYERTLKEIEKVLQG